VTGIVSFSRVPLRVATYLGLIVAVFALAMIGVVIYWRVFHPSAPLIGYTIITAVILFLAAVQLLCLGIIGEYLGRVYEEVKGRPIFTLKEVSGDTPVRLSHAGPIAAAQQPMETVPRR
jgi:dolichol-phosphate mannosyltransferase